MYKSVPVQTNAFRMARLADIYSIPVITTTMNVAVNGPIDPIVQVDLPAGTVNFDKTIYSMMTPGVMEYIMMQNALGRT